MMMAHWSYTTRSRDEELAASARADPEDESACRGGNRGGDRRGALVPGAQVILLGLTVNAVLAATSFGALMVYPLAFATVAVVNLGLTAAQEYWSASLEQQVANGFNLALMDKAGQLSLADFENPAVYDKLQLATREPPVGRTCSSGNS
jgi:hypothetical protein